MLTIVLSLVWEQLSGISGFPVLDFIGYRYEATSCVKFRVQFLVPKVKY